MPLTQGLISIVIVNYNTKRLLQDCLVSLMENDETPREIIVVDNASTDGSAEMVGAHFPNVVLIRNKENVGFSKANNQAMGIANGEFLLLLNSDTVVRPGAVPAMVEFLRSHAEAGAVTCKLLNPDGSIQASVSNRPGPTLLLFRLLGVSRLLPGDRPRRWLARSVGFLLGKTVRAYLDPYVTQNLPIEVENISGACLMLRREVFDNVGHLDERFFMYFEDMDYCLRIRRAGWKLYYVPHGEIVHLVGMSSGGRMRDYSPQSYRALFGFYGKHSSRPMLVVVRTIVFVTSSVKLLWNWILGRFSHSMVYRQNQLDLKQVIRTCFE
jgi:GT2 family glycosyltransferase